MIHIEKTDSGAESVMIRITDIKDIIQEVHILGVSINDQFFGDKKAMAICGCAFVDGLIDGEKSDRIKRKEEIAECHMN